MYIHTYERYMRGTMKPVCRPTNGNHWIHWRQLIRLKYSSLSATAFFYRLRCLPWCKTLPEESSWLGTWCATFLSRPRTARYMRREVAATIRREINITHTRLMLWKLIRKKMLHLMWSLRISVIAESRFSTNTEETFAGKNMFI